MPQKLLSLEDPTFSPPSSGPTPAGGAPAVPLSPLERLQGLGGADGLGLAEKPLAEIIGNIVSGFLGLLGIVFFVYMVWAGYTWMTAQGDEKKVEKARDTIKNSIIDLALVLAAYGITRLVVSLLGQAI